MTDGKKKKGPAKPICGLKLGTFQCFFACMPKGAGGPDAHELVIADGKGKIKVRPEALTIAPDGRERKQAEDNRSRSAVAAANRYSEEVFDRHPSEAAAAAEMSTLANAAPQPKQQDRRTAMQVATVAAAASAAANAAPPHLPPPPAATSATSAAAAERLAGTDPLVDLAAQAAQQQLANGLSIRGGRVPVPAVQVRDALNEGFEENEAMSELARIMSFQEDWAD